MVGWDQIVIVKVRGEKSGEMEGRGEERRGGKRHGSKRARKQGGETRGRI
jgi:hypothetical protein